MLHLLVLTRCSLSLITATTFELAHLCIGQADASSVTGEGAWAAIRRDTIVLELEEFLIVCHIVWFLRNWLRFRA